MDEVEEGLVMTTKDDEGWSRNEREARCAMRDEGYTRRKVGGGRAGRTEGWSAEDEVWRLERTRMLEDTSRLAWKAGEE